MAPIVTASPVVTSSWSSGYWYKDTDWEMALRDVIQELDPSNEYVVRVAVLDADPSQTSYVYHQHWDNTSEMFVDGGLLAQLAITTEDGAAVYVQNRATLDLAIGMLRRVSSGMLPRGQVFYAGMWASGSDDAGLGAEFDPDGWQDALGYLGCF